MRNKILAFATLVQVQTLERLVAGGLDCQANKDNAKTHIHEGKKYTRVDIGSSGRYMVENSTGHIFGIKAYGAIHKGHFYGTVETTADYFWGNYYPKRLATPLPEGRSRSTSCPALTFAPQLAAVV
jgi:hypothetical protein